MKRCRKWNRLRAEALYDELDQKQKEWFENHLKECPVCAKEWDEIKFSLSLMDQRLRPEPDEVFWNGYWDRLTERINSEEMPSRHLSNRIDRILTFFRPVPVWAAGSIAAACLVILGIFLGRVIQPSGNIQNINKPVSGQNIQMASLRDQTADYLKKSKLILLGFANFDSDTEDIFALNLPLQKEKSDVLVKEAVYLKTALNETAENRLQRLIVDLEVILLQIANLETDQGLEAVEIVKSGVEKKGVLFKINIEEIKKISSQKTVKKIKSRTI